MAYKFLFVLIIVMFSLVEVGKGGFSRVVGGVCLLC